MCVCVCTYWDWVPLNLNSLEVVRVIVIDREGRASCHSLRYYILEKVKV